MSLLDDLRAAANAIDPQFHVSSNEVAGVVSSIAAYLEHGDKFLQAAEKGAEDVTSLLAPPQAEPQPVQAATPAPEGASAPAAAATDDELRAQISDLQAQLASREATAQQTQVEHETGGEPAS